jgi:predicted ArsR family transcriptional regulator
VGMYQKMDRVTVAEAAARLGVKEQAVRKRIQRGTLVHDKDEDGRVYVYLDPRDEADGAGNGTDTGTGVGTLVQSLQDQIEYLRAELHRRGETHAEESRRKDHIIAALTERIPELPQPAGSPQEAPGGHEPASEDAGGGDTPPGPQEPVERRSRWRRFFGF